MVIYTDEMRRVVHQLDGWRPKSFQLVILVDDVFINLQMGTSSLMKLSHDDKIGAVNYTMLVAKALEDLGATVQVVREPFDDKK